MKIPRQIKNRMVIEASTTGELFTALESFRQQLVAEGRYAISMETSAIHLPHHGGRDARKVYRIIVECSSSKE